MQTQIFTSGEVARLLGIRKEKLFYLEERGKIQPAQRTGTGKRVYTRDDVYRLRQELKRVNLLKLPR